MKKGGCLITFEGLDKSGKSTQVKLLKAKLVKCKYKVTAYEALGGTTLNKKLKKILLDSKTEIDDITEMLLYMAARREILTKKIMPDLLEKKVVLLDRYVDSTYVYQGAMRGTSLDLIALVHKHIINKVVPLYTFFLKINKETYLERFDKDGISDRLEETTITQYTKLNSAYYQIMSDKERYKIIEEGTVDEVHEQICKYLKI